MENIQDIIKRAAERYDLKYNEKGITPIVKGGYVMNNCFDCKAIKDCNCGEAILTLKAYLSTGLYQQIKDIIITQFDCEYHE